jgi:hypothetical protein
MFFIIHDVIQGRVKTILNKLDFVFRYGDIVREMLIFFSLFINGRMVISLL